MKDYQEIKELVNDEIETKLIKLVFYIFGAIAFLCMGMLIALYNGW